MLSRVPSAIGHYAWNSFAPRT